MDKAISSCLSQHPLPPAISSPLIKKLSKSYSIYGCMLLLPANALEGPEWERIPPGQKEEILQSLYQEIETRLKITHVALNKPIPLLQVQQHEDGDGAERRENILRAPTNFHPLHGNFGPATCSSPSPSQSDFDSAFWVTATQNGIRQTWAPRWTMFSRGNISEKARLLTLPSVLQAVQEGRGEGCRGSAAVDLYAGIGYFAFSYVKAGISRVLCWDLNAWSCEGLRRGVHQNKWGVRMSEGEEGVEGEEEEEEEDVRLVVFNETNERAPERVEAMKRKGRLPPVRHVNCGMLPSSRLSLKLAAEVLDPGFVGWVHVHENFLVEEIEAKAEETRREFERLVRRTRGREDKVEIEYVNRLKNYAPGVMHCVIDIVVYPDV